MKSPDPNSIPPRPPHTPEGMGLYNRADLAALLRVSLRTVSEWQMDEVIPHLKIGRVVLFYWPDVFAALREKFTVAAADSPKPQEPEAAQGGEKSEVRGERVPILGRPKKSGGRRATRPTTNEFSAAARAAAISNNQKNNHRKK